MNKANDLTGQKFNRLFVISRCDNYISPQGKTIVRWLCRCDCGNEVKVSTSSLIKNKTKSCGCFNRENIIKRNLKHNLSKTRLYKIWQGMKKRCYNVNSKTYKNYGGRGIIICQDWLNDFANFYDWAVNNGYTNNLSIDRINVNGNYEPSNCRWITNKEQSNNKRNNHYITFDKETHTMAEWAKIYNINYKLLFSRLKKGWDFEKILNTKVLSHSECGKMAHCK